MDRIPILRMGRCLLVSIQVDMHDRLAVALQDDLTNQITRTGARGVLIDISALELVDSFIGRIIGTIAGMARVLDADTVVVGMRPAVAITLVELGLELPGVRTALTIERGMALLAGGTPMSGPPADALPVRSDADVVQVRQAVRTRAVALGFGLVDQTKIVTAASELARNTLHHGGGGTATIEVVADGRRQGLRLTFEDQGPGIPDVARAMQDGFSTGGGMGLGLGGAKRLTHEFAVESAPGVGTRVTAVRWK